MPMQRRWKTLLLTVLAISLLAGGRAGAQPKVDGNGEAELVTLANEYVEILVNASQENTGRFAIYTTGGDPERPEDDEKPLIYGTRHPGPWTSYTTVQIDGVSWVFGGPTQRRAGRSANYGVPVRLPEREGEAIVAAWQLGPLEVTQVLSFTRSLTTGLMDTVRIAYRVQNTDTRAHQVGLRIMLDTMLGANDGAPFRVGERAVTTDTVLVGSAIPEFWQAFDDLSQPQVMAQGTLRYPGETPPDRIYMTNWGSLADGVWSFDFQAGRDFTRKGEFELDSALAIFWDPEPLAAGEGREYVTYYGLGGIDIAPGQLSLGLTSARTIEGSQTEDRILTVVAYVQNTGVGEALNVTAEILPPHPFQVEGGAGQARRSLGTLPPGGTGQVRWELRIPKGTVGTFTYRVQVHATNAESNEGRREVEVLAPAQVSMRVEAPDRLGEAPDGGYDPPRFPVRVTLTNTGGSAAEWIVARLSPAVQDQLRLEQGNAEERLLPRLAPGESVTLTWYLRPTGKFERGNFYYNIRAQAANTGEPLTGSRAIQVEPLQARVTLESRPISSQANPVGDQRVEVVLQGVNLRNVWGVAGEISYDPEQLRLEHVLVGRVDAVVGAPRSELFREWQVDHSQPGRVRFAGHLGEAEPLTLAKGNLATFWFWPVGSDAAQVRLERLELVAGPGRAPVDVTAQAGASRDPQVQLNGQLQVWLADRKTVEP